MVEGVLVALVVYAIAGSGEAALIRALRPTELELSWVSDLVLSAALGIAVYLWRHLRATRLELTERERAALVIQTQLSLAEGMQRRLLPSTPQPDGRFEWAAALTPAGRIGGDFYDFVQPSPDRWVVLVADVSGKGVPAAMALTLLRSTFRTLARQGQTPAALLQRLSVALYDEWLGMPYVTCIVVQLATDTRVMTYSNAGHPPGVVLGKNRLQRLTRGGPPAGLLPDAQYEEDTISLEQGDVCLLMTDGITEALDDGVHSPLDTIVDSARSDSGSAPGICHAVMARALEGHGPEGVDHWEDDRTVIVAVARDR